MILNDLLINNANCYPTKIACRMQLGFRDFSLTYAQTYVLAQQVAHLLEQNGLTKGDCVLICAPNSPFWGCVFWGCLLKGLVLVPLNTQSTANIIKLIIKQTHAKVIFDFQGFKFNFPELIHFKTDLLDELLANTPTTFSQSTIKPDDLVEIMYTSGTTGEPKGVMLTHANICANLNAINLIIHPNSKQDRVLSILPLSHIYEQNIGFFLPYLNQVEIVYAHAYSEIRKLLSANQITKLLAVPEFLQVFMSKILGNVQAKGKVYEKIFHLLLKISQKVNHKGFSRLLFYPVLKQFGGYLETIASGGAPLSLELELKWRALGIDILQGYGLTETSPVISTNTYQDYLPGSVGKPLNNLNLKIDDTQQIWVCGPSVFSGYYQNSEKTNAVLVDGWFNTEDLGELDQAGFLHIKGRKKYMILTPSGQNVYPEDIESILNNLPGIKDSCVMGIDDKIYAAILPNPELQPNLNDLIEQANQQLASYQRINNWSAWPLEDFPRTATRKIKKNEVADFIKNHATINPSAPLASYSKLVKILAQIAKVEPQTILPTTKIMDELNLDSLGRVELVGALEEELRVTISEQDLNTSTTVNDLEQTIINQKPISESPALKSWPRRWWACLLRMILQNITLLCTRIFVKLEVHGLQNLTLLKYPVIFMPNHVSFIDPALVAMAVPFKIRRQLSFAAARDYLYEQLKMLVPLAELVFNSFPIQREADSNIKLGLEYIGKMLDRGYCVVLFPEGKISKDGQLLPLKLGAGMIGATMACQIVPVKIEGVQAILPYNKIIPRRRAKVIIKFGAPLSFRRSDSFENVRLAIEKALTEL